MNKAIQEIKNPIKKFPMEKKSPIQFQMYKLI